MLYHVRMGLAVIREDYKRRASDTTHTNSLHELETGVDLWAENGTHCFGGTRNNRAINGGKVAVRKDFDGAAPGEIARRALSGRLCRPVRELTKKLHLYTGGVRPACATEHIATNIISLPFLIYYS